MVVADDSNCCPPLDPLLVLKEGSLLLPLGLDGSCRLVLRLGPTRRCGASGAQVFYFVSPFSCPICRACAESDKAPCPAVGLCANRGGGWVASVARSAPACTCELHDVRLKSDMCAARRSVCRVATRHRRLGSNVPSGRRLDGLFTAVARPAPGKYESINAKQTKPT